MTEASVKDPIRVALQELIALSKATIKPDDVLREFCKERRSCKKLLDVLEQISKNQPNATENLLEAAKLLEKKDPFFCLLNFINHYSSVNIMQSMRKMDISHSTPLVTKKAAIDSISPEVIEIKERLVHAASAGAASRTIQPTSAAGSSSLVPQQQEVPVSASLFSALSEKVSNTQWERQVTDLDKFQRCSIAAIPLQSQERLLMTDMLYCLTGISGSYIEMQESSEDPAKCGKAKFRISKQVLTSLREIANEILPLGEHFSCVHKFVQQASSSDCGQVLQALGASLRELLDDYFILLAQLEDELWNGELTLHKMIFYLRPTIITMDALASIVTDIVTHELRGGQVLTLLFERINKLTGDDEPQSFLIRLIKAVATPYMSILQLWVQKGAIEDPQQEFLVEDNEVIEREELPEHYSADYWEKRYTIRRERIPCFLDKVSEIILRTGKYLNVIRQCGKQVQLPKEMNLVFSPTNQEHIAVIQEAYRYASRNLLEVLLKENDMMGHLMSVKRYLLLYQGDFITQFMDACEEELSKNIDQVLPMKLENLLGLTLRLSSAKNDPYKDDVHCDLLTYDLVTQMSIIMDCDEDYWRKHRLDLIGLECFAFRYEVKWPVSLVLNHIAISKYQMLFRQLFFCKHVERQLCRIWKENSITKRFAPQAAELYRSAFTLRQRMMNAVQNLEYYMMIEVIEPNWHTFMQNVKKVENVDEVLTYHQDFLDSCLKNCMLTDSAQLNRSIFKLCKICLNFCEFIQSESSLAPTDTFSQRVHRFDLEFTGLLIGLLKQINDVAAVNPGDRFINLVYRINFNSYYTEQLDKMCAKDAMLSCK